MNPFVNVDMGTWQEKRPWTWSLTFIQEVVESEEESDGIGYIFQEAHFEKSVNNGIKEGKAGGMKATVIIHRRKKEDLN